MEKNAAQHYREQQILNASPAESIVLLYDGAINFLLQARKAIEENRIEDRFNYNKKAGDIICYLIETLDLEQGGGVAQNLYKIYSYAQRRLVDVDMKNSVEPIDDVIPHLRTLKASWTKIANGEIGEENVTNNSEKSAAQPPAVQPTQPTIAQRTPSPAAATMIPKAPVASASPTKRVSAAVNIANRAYGANMQNAAPARAKQTNEPETPTPPKRNAIA